MSTIAQRDAATGKGVRSDIGVPSVLDFASHPIVHDRAVAAQSFGNSMDRINEIRQQRESVGVGPAAAPAAPRAANLMEEMKALANLFGEL